MSFLMLCLFLVTFGYYLYFYIIIMKWLMLLNVHDDLKGYWRLEEKKDDWNSLSLAHTHIKTLFIIITWFIRS